MVICAINTEAKVVVALNPLTASTGLQTEQSAVSDVMQAELSQSEKLTLVDRNQMNETLKELKLGQQGMVSTASAHKLGKIVGCRYFCSGHLRKSGDKIMVTVKVIDIETTLIKLAYTFLKSKDDSIEAGKTLAQQVEKVVNQFEKEKAEEKSRKSETSKAKKIPEAWKRPIVMVIIPEMHVRQPQLIDPAGETEIIKRLINADFKVIDSEYVNLMKTNQAKAKKMFKSIKTSTDYAETKGVDVLLYGEAISERATGLGDFEGCRARVELKAIRVKNDQILVADSAHGGATDLAETVAGKKAIAQAANRLADTFLYSMARKWNK
jgi:TolB-like protein